MKCHPKSFLPAVFALGLALPALGQEVPAGSPGFSNPAPNAGAASETSVPAPAYGTSDFVGLNTGMMAFSPLADGQWTHFYEGWSYRSGGSNTGTCSAVHLPTGALLQYITTWTNDTDAASNITYYLTDTNNSTNTYTRPFSWTSTGTPGIERVARALNPAITINNQAHTYTLCIFHGTTGSTLQSAGVSFWYHLQVSPAPTTATFTDVPVGSTYHRFVEALYASGITAGCGGGNFCPNTPVTRGQMAVFLSAALGLHWPY